MSGARPVPPMSQCGEGFYNVTGDVTGWGTIHGKGGGQLVQNCSACADLCRGFAECRSYECSPTTLKCSLNTVAKPNASAFQDYQFCSTQELCDESAKCMVPLSTDIFRATWITLYHVLFLEIMDWLQAKKTHKFNFTLINPPAGQPSPIVMLQIVGPNQVAPMKMSTALH